MPIEITIPRLGWSMEEGTFAAWLKNHGDKVNSGDPLFAVDSDKVTMDVESLDSGILHIPPDAPQPGTVVTVGQLIGYLLAEGENVPDRQASANGGHEAAFSQPAVLAPSVEAIMAQSDSAPITPRARRIAAELGVNTALLRGSGIGGRIRERDVREASSQNRENGSGEAPIRPPDGGQPVSPQARAVAKALGIDIALVSPAEGSTRIVEADVRRAYESLTSPAPTAGIKTSSTVRKTVATRMEQSFRAPHFYVHAEVDASSLAKVRDEMLSAVEEQYRVRLTYNDLLMKAIAMSLRAVPQLNCYWNEGEIVSRSAVNVGLAVQINDSLMVPVIRDADRLSAAEIAVARHALVEKCRRSEARLSDLQDGSVTLSNLGPFGVDRFQAILNPPQSAIVAVGRIAKRPFVDGDAVVARLTMPLSISVDHRVVDGVAAAAFLGKIVALLQSPLRLVLTRADPRTSSAMT